MAESQKASWMAQLPERQAQVLTTIHDAACFHQFEWLRPFVASSFRLAGRRSDPASLGQRGDWMDDIAAALEQAGSSPSKGVLTFRGPRGVLLVQMRGYYQIPILVGFSRCAGKSSDSDAICLAERGKGKYAPDRDPYIADVYLASMGEGRAAFKIPEEVEIFREISLENMSWESWGSRRARGSGEARLSICDPDCLSGRTELVPVSVSLDTPIRVCGRTFFTKVTFSWKGTVPAGMQDGSLELPSVRC